ncbi:fibulin-7-like [Chiroxiphia lanceolata]|uniref:fibulin-7-like n=1 Tax=Chiroxiphia lanceolata TaxID=296741 RepID=UPI0013CEA618|nr:fibulin-7-like [Chiroxiphia lanceolata]
MLLIPLPAWLALGILQLPLSSTQECLSRQQALSAVRQMQKLLAAQEAAHLRGMRGLRNQLSILQSHLQRQPTKRNDTCPQLAVPLNGRMLGRSVRVGHDVHFVCDSGFRLVGSETRSCRHNRTWSGTQPFCRSMDDCSSNPCANSGTCVDGDQSYTCLCPPGWSGPSCQSPIYSYWVTLSNASFSRQPRCAEGRSGSRRCSCDTGFQLRAGGMCQDVDECLLYQSSPQTRICLHDCLNLPGSYRCLCPPGYLLHADRNACEDVNECAGKQHNCTQGDLCINTFGGHRCVRPKCPPPRHNTSYVKTSAFQCERNPCPMESRACLLAATSISFHYLPLQANRTVPRVLFKMSTTRFVGDSLRFAITGGRGQGVFSVRRSDRQTGELLLTSPVAGPATLEVELEMSEFSRKVLLGKHIFKVTVFVSPYVF